MCFSQRLDGLVMFVAIFTYWCSNNIFSLSSKKTFLAKEEKKKEKIIKKSKEMLNGPLYVVFL